MGVTWSSYKGKRKEKKELKRFAYSCVIFIWCENEKNIKHALYAVEKKNWIEKKCKSNLV